MDATNGTISVLEGAVVLLRTAALSWSARMVFIGLMVALLMLGDITALSVIGSVYIALVIAPAANFQREILRMKHAGVDVSSMPAAFLIYSAILLAMGMIFLNAIN